MKENSHLSSILVLPESKAASDKELFLIFATSDGTIRKNSLEDFKKIQSSGKIAMKAYRSLVKGVALSLVRRRVSDCSRSEVGASAEVAWKGRLRS